MDRWILYDIGRAICQAFCLVLFRYRAHHLVRVPPKGPYLLVANHQSYLDPVLAGLPLSGVVRYVARRTLFVGPFGWLIRRLGAYPVSRDGRDIAAIRETFDHLRCGQRVLIFPEGTRSRDGRLGTFRPGFVAIARRANARILPVYVDGSYRAWPRGQILPRMTPVRVVYGRMMSIGPGEEETVVVRRVQEALLGLQREAEAIRRVACG